MSESTYIRAGRYYSIDKAAMAMGYTSSRVRQLVRANEIEHFKVSERHYLIPAIEVKRLKKRG